MPSMSVRATLKGSRGKWDKQLKVTFQIRLMRSLKGCGIVIGMWVTGLCKKTNLIFQLFR